MFDFKLIQIIGYINNINSQVPIRKNENAKIQFSWQFAKISSRENFQVHGICQDGGAVGFVDFTKLSFALSSLTQPFDQMRCIPEYVFVLLSRRKAYTGRFQKETAGKRTGSRNKMAAPKASVHSVRNRLCYHFFLYKRTKVVPKVLKEGDCCLEGLINLACGLQLQMLPRLKDVHEDYCFSC